MSAGAVVVRFGTGRIRVGPFRGNDRIAYVAPVGEWPAPSADAVRHCVSGLADRGYEEAITSALGPAEAHGFIAAGFTVHERLHLLSHDLRDLGEPPPVTLRRGRRTDRHAALAVDGRAFDSFWRLDDAGFEEAMTATPTSRFRIADAPGHTDAVGGYAVTGRAGARGFLQRLAVDPDYRGLGIGTALVLDALVWLRRRGVDSVVVNTQEANTRALSLYEHLGFRRQPAGLAVLRLPLRP